MKNSRNEKSEGGVQGGKCIKMNNGKKNETFGLPAANTNVSAAQHVFKKKKKKKKKQQPRQPNKRHAHHKKMS